MQESAEYITIKEAGALAGVHTDTIRRLVKANIGSKYIIRGKGKKAPYLISKDMILHAYSLKSTDTDQSAETTEQVTGNPSKQGTEQASEQTSSTTDTLIKALTDELQAKNTIIKQQQETIQKIVDQQQQLTGMLVSSNAQKSGDKSSKPTSVIPIEDKARERKAKEKKPIGKNKGTKTHWWQRSKS